MEKQKVKEMAIINKILNIVLPIITVSFLVVFMPFSIFFKLLGFIRRYKETEKVTGKVVIITGSSSGIGEHLAYEYARRGAYLTLVARREDRLRVVADRCRKLGSPEVAVVRGDVSVIEDCKRFVQETISRFGRLDHLVNNAGIAEAKFFQDYSEISDVLPIMNTNFWGPVYATHFAIPHLKKTKGKIVAVASPAGWAGVPRMSIYAASKAAMINFYETLRIELRPDIGVTMVFPGLIENGNTNPDLLAEKQEWSQVVAIESAAECAKAVVNGICRGKTLVAEPSWVRVLFWLSTLCPELLISKPNKN